MQDKFNRIYFKCMIGNYKTSMDNFSLQVQSLFILDSLPESISLFLINLKDVHFKNKATKLM